MPIERVAAVDTAARVDERAPAQPPPHLAADPHEHAELLVREHDGGKLTCMFNANPPYRIFVLWATQIWIVTTEVPPEAASLLPGPLRFPILLRTKLLRFMTTSKA